MKANGLTPQQRVAASKIAAFCITHNRVLTISGGELSLASIGEETANEARAQGYESSIAAAMRAYGASLYR